MPLMHYQGICSFVYFINLDNQVQRLAQACFVEIAVVREASVQCVSAHKASDTIDLLNNQLNTSYCYIFSYFIWDSLFDTHC